ncbi:MAG TPA: putative porin [Terriglobales bacterium]
MQSLKDALAAQQQQIEQLRQELQQRDQAWQQAQQQLQQAQSSAAEAQQKAAAVQASADEQKSTVTKLSSDVADVQTTLTNTALNTQDDQKRFSALEGLVGRFRFNGDIRVRGESFFQDNVADRNRARLRVRFGFDGKLNEDFTAGLWVSTGSLGDPTSTNTTMTNFFEKHTIGLDRAFVTYNPKAAKWLSLTSGKFPYTWTRSPYSFDSDLNPEGFSQKFSFDIKSNVVKNFTFMAMQLLFNESGGGTDSYALGGQVSTKLQMGPWTMTPSFSLLKWNNIDAILAANAFAVQATSSGTPPIQVPGEGPGCGRGGPSVPPCIFAANGLTNAIVTDAGGARHFYSQYNYADVIWNNQFKTPWARFPLVIVGEYLNNLDAQDHPLDSTGAVLTDLGSQSQAYGVDISIGQTRNKNDIQLGYAWLRQEQDSVIASFNESDQRAPTNILQNKIYVNWKLRSNIVAGYTYFFGRTLNTNLQNAARSAGVAVGAEDAMLHRMQFDLIYTF